MAWWQIETEADAREVYEVEADTEDEAREKFESHADLGPPLITEVDGGTIRTIKQVTP